MLTVLPIRYVADVEASREFYAGLGLTVRQEPGAAVWVRLTAAAGALGVHASAVSQGRPSGTTELGFATDEPLEEVAQRLQQRGYPYELVEENFGRSIRVTDPDGVVVQIQQIDPDTVRRSTEALTGDIA
ncbi:VOC family protein [Streptomyces sp. NPDC090045]|uniref:VOC family protein n=1 Tax=Streptomyces sp. NPDC090045 TaxID=3365927 RepID=UPI003810EBB1